MQAHAGVHNKEGNQHQFTCGPSGTNYYILIKLMVQLYKNILLDTVQIIYDSPIQYTLLFSLIAKKDNR